MCLPGGLVVTKDGDRVSLSQPCAKCLSQARGRSDHARGRSDPSSDHVGDPRLGKRPAGDPSNPTLVKRPRGDPRDPMLVKRPVYQTIQDDKHCVKVIPLKSYRETLAAYWLVGSHDHVNEVEEILLGETQAYVFFPRHYGDLHSYVRSKRKLKEQEAIRLFRQIVSAVNHCHENGVVLRDLKLRKFVFKDEAKTELRLEGLEDACVLEDESNDHLADKHGCPAYVSPEILATQRGAGYSGKLADVWSLGVMLYTMLVGRYPFHDTQPSALFTKIRRGQYSIPDSASSRAKCLIRSLLRRDPAERLTAEEALAHPWFTASPLGGTKHRREDKNSDQCVPQVAAGAEDVPWFI